MAERLAETPWVFSRWSASSAWVQLARSSPCLDRPLDDPAADLLAQVSRDLRRSALGLAGPEAVEAPVEVGVEPALDGAGRDPEVGGDVPVLAAPVGQADDLEAIAGLAVGGLAEGQFEALGLVLGEMDADHGRVESLGSSRCTSSLYEPDSIIGLVRSAEISLIGNPICE